MKPRLIKFGIAYTILVILYLWVRGLDITISHIGPIYIMPNGYGGWSRGWSFFLVHSAAAPLAAATFITYLSVIDLISIAAGGIIGFTWIKRQSRKAVPPKLKPERNQAQVADFRIENTSSQARTGITIKPTCTEDDPPGLGS
jgi:hypothetical protein